jgi:hypothetical protein
MICNKAKIDNYKLHQTWQELSLGGSLSKLCPTALPSIQDGCYEQLNKFLFLVTAAILNGGQGCRTQI